MTPPSYYQSQNQYNQPTRRESDMPNVYVPTYTERAGEYDMGYYDNEGNFHPNPNAKDPTVPPQAYQGHTSSGDGVLISNDFPTYEQHSQEEQLRQQSRGTETTDARIPRE